MLRGGREKGKRSRRQWEGSGGCRIRECSEASDVEEGE